MVPIVKLETTELDGTASVAPSAVLSYSDIQNHLKLDGSADQTLVESLIEAATKRVEAFIGRKLVTQHWSIYFDKWPGKYNSEIWWDGERDGAVSELYSASREIELPFGPCQSISFVRAYDQTDGTTTLDASLYTVDTIGPFGRIALKIGGTWPAVTLRPANGVHVRGVFGFGSASQVPTDIKHAVKMLTAKMYEHRGDNSEGEFFGFSGFTIPNTAQSLLEPYRVHRLR